VRRAASAAAIALALAAAPRVRADDEPKPAAATVAAASPGELLAAETDSIDRALATVTEKLAAADAARARRVRAAYRVLSAPAADPLASARSRAAARLLLARDAAERALLADEAARLRAAHGRVAADETRLGALAAPAELLRPAHGSIARHAGTIEHERSRATLARRGLDFEVDDRAPASAPAAGTVRYAGPIRGLDNGVIVDAGDYLVVVAKLGDLTVPVGAAVARGDRLGRAARHRVYLEVRLKVGPGGLPIDPEPLLAK
jgi:murein hydrolase activator